MCISCIRSPPCYLNGGEDGTAAQETILVTRFLLKEYYLSLMNVGDVKFVNDSDFRQY